MFTSRLVLRLLSGLAFVVALTLPATTAVACSGSEHDWFQPIGGLKVLGSTLNFVRHFFPPLFVSFFGLSIFPFPFYFSSSN